MADEAAKNPYINPQVASWLDYLEGIPEPVYPSPLESSAERAARSPWQNFLNQKFDQLGLVLPGLTLALLLAVIARVLAEAVGEKLLAFERSPISAIFVVVILGLAIRNLVGLPVIYSSGLKMCLRRLLRLGIILLGIRLSLLEVGRIGLAALPVVAGCILAGIVAVTWIGRAMRLPRRLSTLIAVGTSICGVSAIAATGPAIDAEEHEISYAVAIITLFGMIALILHPFIAHLVFPHHPELAGVFLGTAVHDTAQVAGSALMYEQQYNAPAALDYAVVTKLIRNLFMLAVIPVMTLAYHRSVASGGRTTPLHKLVPLFVLGFLAMTALRAVGDLGDRPFGFLSKETWAAAVENMRSAADWCLVVAMAAVGLGTSLSQLRSLGWKPLVAGFAAAVSVGVLSVVMIGLVHAYTTWFASSS
ncbi:MAG TPA: putative sulfate exporter family transporter [Lacipirellulaceae bacterium]